MHSYPSVCLFVCMPVFGLVNLCLYAYFVSFCLFVSLYLSCFSVSWSYARVPICLC